MPKVQPDNSENASSSSMNPTRDDFASMLDESFKNKKITEGDVVKGRVSAIENGFVIIDIGIKMEGRVAQREFENEDKATPIAPGDEVDVYLESIENGLGEAVLSREKARRAVIWDVLEKIYQKNEIIEAMILSRVRAGFTVDLNGIIAFLPRLQVDTYPIHNPAPLMATPQPFRIIKMDKDDNQVIVSRRAALEDSRVASRREIVQGLTEGQIVEGDVKNLTEYGAFVDLGGVDGLLHVTDITWRRLSHPSEVLTIGDKIRVQILRINNENQRINLGMKQLVPDPWSTIENKFKAGDRVMGRVSSITEYGAFVDLGDSVEGLVHISEVAYGRRIWDPADIGKIISTSQEIEVKILEIDFARRRISLSIKQCQKDPFDAFIVAHPVGTKINGPVRDKTDLGLFVQLTENIDGRIRASDIDAAKSDEAAIAAYEVGQNVEAIITDINTDKRQISLSVKALSGDDPFALVQNLKKGENVSAMVTAVLPDGLEVVLSEHNDLPATIRRSELSRDHHEQRTERFIIGNEIKAVVTNVNWKTHRITLSIKAREAVEEKAALESFNAEANAPKGTSLGALLDVALKRTNKNAKTETVDGKNSSPKDSEATEDSATENDSVDK